MHRLSGRGDLLEVARDLIMILSEAPGPAPPGVDHGIHVGPPEHGQERQVRYLPGPLWTVIGSAFVFLAEELMGRVVVWKDPPIKSGRPCRGTNRATGSRQLEEPLKLREPPPKLQ